MTVHVLGELQYSNDRKGPWKLYVFNKEGFHEGGTWFEEAPTGPEAQQLTTAQALARIEAAMSAPDIVEVRIADRMDMLVFRSYGRAVLYGEPFLDFLRGVR